MLTVREPFTLGETSFDRGARITDPKIAEQVLQSHPTHVLRTHHHPSPAEAPAAQDSAAEAKESEADTRKKPATDGAPRK